MTQTEINRTRSLNFRRRLADLFTQVQFVVFTTVVLCLLALGYLWHRMFVMVPPGFLGVMYRTVNGGTVTDRTWGEGLHVIPPWDRLYLYEVRMQQKTLDFKVLSDEGLTLGIEVVVRFRTDGEMLGYLQKDIGPEYFDRLIRPEIESHIRRTFGSRPAHELYATVRDVLQEIAQFPLIGRFEKAAPGGPAARPYVHVQDLKIVIISLPKIVEEAIVEKYRQEQLMLAYKYKLEREIKEADRKRTEATGIRDFNLIAGKNVDILRWRSLEVASEFAASPNAKVVVLGGSGQGALPMILNLADGASSAAAADAAPGKKPAAGKETEAKAAANAAPAPPAAAKPR